MNTMMLVVSIATATWAAADASRLGARRGRLGGGFLDMGPVAWFFAVLLLWIVGFPCYLVARNRLMLARHHELQARGQGQRFQAVPVAAVPQPQVQTRYGTLPDVAPDQPHPPSPYGTPPPSPYGTPPPTQTPYGGPPPA